MPKDLVLSALQSAKRGATDLANAPRAIKASSDLSAAGRQGLILIPGNPVLATRAFGKQLKSLVSAKYYDKFKRDLDLHPYIELAEESGLHLTSLGDGHMEHREEAFLSEILGNDPYFKNKPAEALRKFLTFPVRASERAYVTMLDDLRMNVFAKEARNIHEQNARAGRADDPKQYEGLAKFINRASGRGDLGKLDDLAPVLNTLFFSPRYWASRLQVMNPAFYAKLPPGARFAALKNMAAFVGSVALVMVMLKAMGFEVETGDEDNPDLLKLKLGNYSYEFTAGLVSHMRYAARMIMAAVESKDNKAATDKMQYLTGRYMRSKLAPIPAAGYNAYTGENYLGEPTGVADETKALFTPIMADNYRDAFKADGAAGLIKMTPEFFGISTSRHREADEIKTEIQKAQQVLDNAKTPAEQTEAKRRLKAWRKQLARAVKYDKLEK